jgi:hypothetical protein
LNGYRYRIIYKEGENIPHADVLSRSPNSDAAPIESVENTIFTIDLLDLRLSALEIPKATERDPDLSRLLAYTHQGWPTEVESKLQPNFQHKLDLSVEFGCVAWGARVYT